jgi:hypothetical protein
MARVASFRRTPKSLDEMLVNPAPASKVAKTDDDAHVIKNASNFSFTIPPKILARRLTFFVVLIVAKVAWEEFSRRHCLCLRTTTGGDCPGTVLGANDERGKRHDSSPILHPPLARENAANRRTASRLPALK